MENVNQNNYQDVSSYTSTGSTRIFRKTQVSLLLRSMIYAGIGFVLIGLIGFGISKGILSLILKNNINQASTTINLLWVFSMILILVALIISMVVTRKFFFNMGQVAKSTLWAMWIIYIIAEGMGFGILFLAFELQFPGSNGQGNEGVLYLTLIFVAGGVAFLLSALIGKALSNKATVSLGRFIGIATFGFMIIFFVCMILMIAFMFSGSGNTFMNSGLWPMLIGISTILFLLYLVFDISVIAKTQQFINMEDSKLVFTTSMIFGFRLLVDLIGLVWNVAYLFLRFKR